MTINFDHNSNRHTLDGAKAALPYIFGNQFPQSLLDVGCGVGTWVRAAMDFGCTDVCGIDGVNISDDDLSFPRTNFRQVDLTQKWNLDRKFDVALCLEVGEHLPNQSATALVQTLVAHSDIVVFSGACPGQVGQHHINCQWPSYWQRLFNAEGFACDDSVRWKIWEIESVEPWYRQNIFVATRAAHQAGREPRLKSVIHPEMLAIVGTADDERRMLTNAVNQSKGQHVMTHVKAGTARFKSRLGRVINAWR